MPLTASKTKHFPRRPIIDHFVGRLDPDITLDAWHHLLTTQIADVRLLLGAGDRKSKALAKQRVNEIVAQRLAHTAKMGRRDFVPIRVDIDTPGVFVVRSEPAPAFIYALSTALSLQALSIERVHVRQTSDELETRVYFVNQSGHPVTDSADLEPPSC